MKIGIDFDNTIVCYDEIFNDVALKLGYIQNNKHLNKSQVKKKITFRN